MSLVDLPTAAHESDKQSIDEEAIVPQADNVTLRPEKMLALPQEAIHDNASLVWWEFLCSMLSLCVQGSSAM
jgi:hypothetical protein